MSLSGVSVAQGVVRCECGVLFEYLFSSLAGGLPFMARVALLACVGGLEFAVCAFGGFLP